MRPRLLTRLASIGIAAAIATLAAGADASSIPIARRSAVGAELRWWNSERGGASLPLVPFFHYEVIPDLFIDAELAIAPLIGGDTVSGLEDVSARLGLGNWTVGAHYASTTSGGGMTWFAGARVGLPLATLGDLHSDRANDLASASAAHADFYRWVPELVPLIGTAGFEAHPTAGFWLRFPVDFMVLIPTTDRRETKRGFVGRIELEGQSEGGVGAGGALQLAVSDGFRTLQEDQAQAAIEHYFVYDNDRFFMRFGVLMALDEPLGPGVFEGGVLSARLTMGGHLR
jgi:hypothetical protein